MDRALIIAAIETYCRVQTDKDKAGWAALFADDVRHEDPVGLGLPPCHPGRPARPSRDP